MDYGTIRYDIDQDGILLLTLNRPERMNAFTVAMCAELVDAYDRASADDRVRAVVLAGEGKNFCVGMDLSVDGNVFGLNEAATPTMDDLLARPDDPDILHGVRDTGGQVTLAMLRCTKPIIAAIQGVAVGIGATMTLAADIRIAAADARIGFVFGKIGITPEACSTWLLPRLVGLQQAFEWVYGAEPFPASEGLAKGLLRSVHPADEVQGVALGLAKRFTHNRSPVATAMTRAMLLRHCGDPTPARAHRTESLAIHFAAQRDGREGVAAFREKRAAHFTGRVSSDMPPGFPWE